MMEESGVVETVSDARADGIMDVSVRRNEDRWRIVGRGPGFVCIRYQQSLRQAFCVCVCACCDLLKYSGQGENIGTSRKRWNCWN